MATPTNEGKRLATSDYTKVQANYERIKPSKLAPSQKERNPALKKSTDASQRNKKYQMCSIETKQHRVEHVIAH